MNDEEIHYEYYEYVSPYNVLVVTHDGELINVLCPFKVKAKVNFPQIRASELVWVEKVQLTEEKKDVFIIGGNAYYIRFFQIVINN